MSKLKKDVQKSYTPKQKYKIINWSEYNNALKNRGNITLYFSEEAINKWYCDLPTQKGAQYVYSDLCIEACMMVKCLFTLPYRQLEGMLTSLLDLMNFSHLKVPSYTQICRRAEKLEIVPFKIPSGGSMHIPEYLTP